MEREENPVIQVLEWIGDNIIELFIVLLILVWIFK